MGFGAIALALSSCGGKVVFDDASRGGAGAKSNGATGGFGGAPGSGGAGGAGGEIVAAGGCGGGLAWAITFGGGGEDRVEEIATAGDGRTVVVGGIHDVVQVGSTTMTATGGMDAYVLVLDADGEVEWARVFGDGTDQLAKGVAVSETGTIYVAGTAEGAIDFGMGPVPSAGASDVFVMALSPTGETLWGQMYGGPERDVGEDVALTPSGELYVVGSMGWSVQVGNDVLVHSGADDAFLAKLSSSGQPQWAKLFGGPGFQGIRSVASDSQSNVIVTGETTESIAFGGGPLPFDDKADAFVAKLSPSGLHLWSTAFSGPGFQEGFGVSVDTKDAIVATGLYEGTVSFAGNEPLVSLGARDIYLAKLGPDGQNVWSRSFGDTAIQSVRHVATAPDDSILLTGPASMDVNFGCGRAGGEAGSPKAAVSKFDPAGNLSFGVLYEDAEGIPGEHQYALSATADGGDLVVGGHFYIGISIGSQSAQSNGHLDAFVAKHVGVP